MDPIKQFFNDKDFVEKSVLVVDDEPMIRQMVCRHLKRTINPKTLIEATDGYEALKKMANQDFDLIILDLLMPKLGGMEMIRELRTKNKFKNIPIIVISGGIEEENITEMVRWGVRNIITKPFSAEVLFKNIQKAMGQEAA